MTSAPHDPPDGPACAGRPATVTEALTSAALFSCYVDQTTASAGGGSSESRRRRRAQHARGFTLTELVIVIVLVGILAAVAGPRMFDRRAFDTRAFHDELFAAVRYAQRLATATQCVVRVDVNSSLANGYRLLFPDNTADCDGPGATFTGANPVPSPDLSGTAFTNTAPGGVIIAGTLLFTYDPIGRPSAGGSANVVGTDTRTLTVEPETGFVH